jgi:hypothetical protein
MINRNDFFSATITSLLVKSKNAHGLWPTELHISLWLILTGA